MDKRMKSLLKWGIENSDPKELEAMSKKDGQPLDISMIDHILGRTEAEVMKEYFDTAYDERNTIERRVNALTEIEMLVFNIDNGICVDKMHLWPKLIDGVRHENHEIMFMSIWIMGSCVQNNHTVKETVFNNKYYESVVEVACTSEEERILKKCLYFLLSFLQNYREASEEILTAEKGDQMMCKLLESNSECISSESRRVLSQLLETNTITPSQCEKCRFFTLLSK